MAQRQRWVKAMYFLLLPSLGCTGCVAVPKESCRVETSPPGAIIVANGAEVGRTPCSIVNYDIPRRRDLEIVATLAGHRAASRTLGPGWMLNFPSHMYLELAPLQEKPGTPASVPDCDLSDLPAITGERASVAVLDFRVDDKLSSGVGESLADFCRETVQDSNRFVLVDREEMRVLLSEQDLVAAIQCDDARCLVNYGRKLRAQKIMYGRAVRVGSAFVLTLRMVDVGSAEIQGIKTAKVGDSADYLVDFISPLTCQLLYDALSQ